MEDYAIFIIRGHVTNGLETITDLCPLDGSIGTAAVILHTHIPRGHRSPTCFPELLSVSMDRVVCLSGGHGVVLQNGVTVGAFIGNGGFERWISLCYVEGMLFFPKPLMPGKHFGQWI